MEKLKIYVFLLFLVCAFNISFTISGTFSQTKIENLSLMPRNHHVMAYDTESDRIVLFGGYEPNKHIIFNETWSYDVNNNVWTRMNPEVAPVGGVSPAMVYDSKIDKMVLFGGLTEVNNHPIEYAETWTYDLNANKWENLNPTNPPEPRIAHRMVYDSELDLIIMQGGHRPSTGTTYNDIWTYNYSANSWKKISVKDHPSRMDYCLFVYVPDFDKTVYFGDNGQTWIYDAINKNYTNINPTSSPIGRGGSAVSYNTNNDEIILFGGSSNGYSSGLKDLWSYDYSSNTWGIVNLSNSPSERFFSSMAFDSESNSTILFGGGNSLTDFPYNDTWSFNFDLNEWSQIKPSLTSLIQNKKTDWSFTFFCSGMFILLSFKLIRRKRLP